MKIIASCLLALGAVTWEASAFAFTQSPAQRQRSNIRLQAASVDDESSLVANGADPEFELLGLPARPGRPLKVAIAGGGVGGLTTAYYMLKKVRLCNAVEICLLSGEQSCLIIN